MRTHWIIIVKKGDSDKANAALVDAFGKHWEKTFTVGLYDSREREMRRWCGIWLDKEQRQEIAEVLDKAGALSEWHKSVEKQGPEILAALNLHTKTEPELLEPK